MNAQKTGEFIAQKRKEKNLTQKQLAEKIGVTDKAVSRWETGKGMPDVSLLQPLAETLGVSLCELLNGEEISKTDDFAVADEIIADTLKKSDEKDKKYKAVLTAVLFAALVIFVAFVVYIGSALKIKTGLSGNFAYSVGSMFLNIFCSVLIGAFTSFLSSKTKDDSEFCKIESAVIAVLSGYLMLSWLLAFTPLAIYIPQYLRPNSALTVLLGSVVFGSVIYKIITAKFSK